MKNTSKFKSIILIISLLLITNCSSNNTMKPQDFLDTKPEITIEEYFKGNVKAWGLLQDRKGKVTRQFKADMFGSFEDNVLSL